MVDYTLTHPEKFFVLDRVNYMRKSLQEDWDLQIRQPGTFHSHLANYLVKSIDKVAGKFNNSGDATLYVSLMFIPPVFWLREHCSMPDSYATYIVMDDTHKLYNTFIALTGSPDSKIQEIASTSMLLYFMLASHTAHKSPIYTTSPDLSWALLHTELRNYPVDMLQLPFPCIYVSLPSTFSVYNQLSGWHSAEGAYVQEELGTANRTWRIMVVGSPKNGNRESMDDALYHFMIEMPPEATVESAIKHTVEKFYGNSVVEDIVVNGTVRKLSRGTVAPTAQTAYANMSKHTEAIFRYILNVVIYATSTDADVTFYNASKEYRLLSDRAQKAQGKKRKDLFSRLSKLTPGKRYLLGKDIVIDRKKEAAESSDAGKRTMKVRTYVAGYWNHYWVGEGRTQRIAKLVKPHFRGPEEAPLTENKKRVLR